ncbi:MAG: pyridoxamine 5'-phosphate oxidase family protein [Chloroflexi bacterium]|nr:pyridoxamine 5'-phosphate oxidase family protein [Chloroflexota bacterium]
MNDETRKRILAYLAAHNTLTLATSHENQPWANAIFYANDGFTVYFVSDPKTRHADHLKQNANIAGTIQDEQKDWRLIQGIQLEGHCEEITDPIESAKALAVYAAKFPFIDNLIHAPKEIASAMAKARWHKINLTWIRLIDNTRGMGFKEEIRFP